MPPPTPLTITTSSLQRLIKEEASYHRELQLQQQSIDRLESAARMPEEGDDDDEERGNREFVIRQEVC
jgi:tubulin-specific chaperone A